MENQTKKLHEDEMLLIQHTIKDRAEKRISLQNLCQIEDLYALMEKFDSHLGNIPFPLEGSKETDAEIFLLHCEHCGKPLLAVFDSLKTDGWPYFGVQSINMRSYSYSPIIKWLRDSMHDVWKVKNPLINSHTKIHCEIPTFDLSVKSYSSVMNLCNSCFRLTYKRFLVLGKFPQGELQKYSVSVVEQWGETLDSACRLVGLEQWKCVGKGAIKEY